MFIQKPAFADPQALRARREIAERSIEACGSRKRNGGCAPVGDPDDIQLPAAHEIAGGMQLVKRQPWT